MENICQEIIRILSKGEVAALATIISREGSAPRGEGAKCLMKADGTLVGSISGGYLENKSRQEAIKTMKDGKYRVLRFELNSEEIKEEGMICGGKVEVLIEPLVSSSLDLYRAIAEVIARGEVAALATLISRKADGEIQGSKVLVRQDGMVSGALRGTHIESKMVQKAKEVFGTKKPLFLLFILTKEEKQEVGFSEEESVEVFLEPVFPPPSLFIFGGGHISFYLAKMAKMADFKVVVVDDRPEFANRDRFPNVDEVCHLSYRNVLDNFRINEASYLVIMTASPFYDGMVLEQVVKTKAKYIGMIGSRNKARILFENLRDRRIPDDLLNSVHVPIGLDIGAETPVEVAVSILSELIKVKSLKNSATI